MSHWTEQPVTLAAMLTGRGLVTTELWLGSVRWDWPTWKGWDD